ncbi:MAG: prefoldin subunit beta [Thaumarchaeota archaeon]|mgnify:FL=1|jgi:prefoldin beta subunit|nr:prefoldin subunit beta [Nitrososphaerales archaeon]NSL73808.1 prefoldin subunit beta [Nitrososphaerota archaeon]NSL74336.1 prefoldin subunit beta [Nitrososphaerota archaeon]HIM82858.1 prefoldin subunit beta [Nitrososphaerales archaeon]|tara:strand:+ start:850 stop:1221 length:372 start_codon:yes stop_codon:yes gene_type:complete
MSNQEVPPWLKEQLERYEQLQQNLQSILVQKQQIDLESIEIDKALEELNKSADDVKVYKSAGTVMVSSNKADVVKNLTESKDLSNTKITVLNKQEERLKESLKEVQEKLDEAMKRSTTGANTQ